MYNPWSKRINFVIARKDLTEIASCGYTTINLMAKNRRFYRL